MEASYSRRVRDGATEYAPTTCSLMCYSAAAAENIARMLVGGSNVTQNGVLASPHHNGVDISLNSGLYEDVTLFEVKGAVRRLHPDGTVRETRYVRFKPYQLANMSARCSAAPQILGDTAGDLADSLDISIDDLATPSYVVVVQQDIPGQMEIRGRNRKFTNSTNPMDFAQGILPRRLYVVDSSIVVSLMGAQKALYDLERCQDHSPVGIDSRMGKEDYLFDTLSLDDDSMGVHPSLSWVPNSERHGIVGLMKRMFAGLGYDLAENRSASDFVHPNDFGSTRFRPATLDEVARVIEHPVRAPYMSELGTSKQNSRANFAARAAVAYLRHQGVDLQTETFSGAWGIPTTIMTASSNPSNETLDEKLHQGTDMMSRARRNRNRHLIKHDASGPDRTRPAIWSPHSVLSKKDRRSLAWQCDGAEVPEGFVDVDALLNATHTQEEFGFHADDEPQGLVASVESAGFVMPKQPDDDIPF